MEIEQIVEVMAGRPCESAVASGLGTEEKETAPTAPKIVTPKKKRKKISTADESSDTCSSSDDEYRYAGAKVAGTESDGPIRSHKEAKSYVYDESDVDDIAPSKDNNKHAEIEMEDSKPQQRFGHGGEGILCDVCFLAEGDTSFVKCRKCHLVVHSDCYFAAGDMPIDEEGMFSCDACRALSGEQKTKGFAAGKSKKNKRKDLTATPSPGPLSQYIEAKSDGRNYPSPTTGTGDGNDDNIIASVDVFCQLCARRDVRGGMKETDTPGRWVHLACMMTSIEAYNDAKGKVAGINKVLSRTKQELADFERDVGNKAICEGCFRSNAVLLRCAEADCHMHFHPLCAEITNRASVVTAVDQGDIIEFKCAIHTSSQGEQHSSANCCVICGVGNKWSDMIGCEGCARWYHLFCLVPQLQEVPDGDWFCNDCHEIGRRMLSDRERVVVEAGD